MVKRAVVVGIRHAPRVRRPQRSERESVRTDVQNPDNGFAAAAQCEWHAVVCPVLCEAHVHPGVSRRACVEQHPCLSLVFLHGEDEIFLRIVYHDNRRVTAAAHSDVLRNGSLCGERNSRKGNGLDKNDSFHRFVRIVSYYILNGCKERLSRRTVSRHACGTALAVRI